MLPQKTKNEIPFYYRFAGQLGLHKLLPTRLLKSSNFITNWFFGTSSTFDKQLLKQILIDTDPTFLKWAIDKVTRWINANARRKTYFISIMRTESKRQNFTLPSGVIFLIALKCNSTPIKNGGHLMTLNKADELNCKYYNSNYDIITCNDGFAFCISSFTCITFRFDIFFGCYCLITFNQCFFQKIQNILLGIG